MARGGFILLLVICFAAYWGWQYYKNRSGREAELKKSKSKRESEFGPGISRVDALKASFEEKIRDIESRSQEEIKKSEELLNYYKEELEKLN